MTSAQDTVLNASYKRKLDSLDSHILHQKRYIEVFTPANHKPENNTKYDVLYVLDGGNWNTGLITQVQSFTEGQGNMPPTIIVSVMGIDRNKELTPTPLENWKGSGDADKFLAFIKNELIPHVNKNYPSNGENMLWGHSLSGMFAIYAMLNEAATFKSYIAVDPSMWWDNSYVIKMAGSKLPALEGFDITLFISGREGVGLNEMKIDSIDEVLKKMAPKSLNWKLIAYPDETHSSIRLKSTYDALKYMYAGHTASIEFHPMNGIVLKDKPIKVWYFDDTTRARYTIDGTLPTTSSPNARREIILTGPAKVTYRHFTNRKQYDITATGVFTDEKMPRPLSKQRNLKPGGFKYEYYEGDWNTWPDLKKEKAVKTGVTDKNFDIDSFARKKNYALLIDGFLEIKEEGYHIFILQADKNSKLYLGDKLLVNWDGDYNRQTYSYILPLSKGFYPLRIEYLHKNEDFKLRMSYLTPGKMNGQNPMPIPYEVQYSGN